MRRCEITSKVTNVCLFLQIWSKTQGQNSGTSLDTLGLWWQMQTGLTLSGMGQQVPDRAQVGEPLIKPEHLLFLSLNIKPSDAPIVAALPCFVWVFSLSSESKLYVCFQSFVFFPPSPPFSLSHRIRAWEPVHAVVCLRVCLRTNVCRLGFPLNISLMLLFIYLFPPPVKALLRRLGLQRIGHALLWVPSISEEPFWRMNRWPWLPITHQLETEAVFFFGGGGGLCPGNQTGSCFIPTLPLHHYPAWSTIGVHRGWNMLSPARRVYHCTQSPTI